MGCNYLRNNCSLLSVLTNSHRPPFPRDSCFLLLNPFGPFSPPPFCRHNSRVTIILPVLPLVPTIVLDSCCYWSVRFPPPYLFVTVTHIDHDRPNSRRLGKYFRCHCPTCRLVIVNIGLQPRVNTASQRTDLLNSAGNNAKNNVPMAS